MAKYDLNETFDLNKFNARCAILIEKGAKCELVEKKPSKSISQNGYLHVVFKLYGIHHGYTEAEAKTRLKRIYGLFVTKEGKNGQKPEKFLRSCSELDSRETAAFITWIRNRSSIEGGFYIETAEEYLINQFKIKKMIDEHKEFL